MRRPNSGWLVLVTIEILIALPTAGALAADHSNEFLDKLLAQGMYDEALEYLDKIEQGPSDSPLRDQLDLQRGMTLLAASRAPLSFEARHTKLSESQRLFRKFIAENAEHELVTQARSELANSLVEQARILVFESKRVDVKEKANQLKEARRCYDEAGKIFQAVQEEIRGKLSRIPAAAAGPQIAARDQLRAEYVKIQLVQAAVLFELATAHQDDTLRNDKLAEAARAYHDIYEKYRRRLAGLYAQLHEGRCYQEMGQAEKAVKLYKELLEHPDRPEPFRVLRTKTLVSALECLVNSPGPFDETVVNAATQWVETTPPDGAKGEDALTLQLNYALVCSNQAADAQDKEEAKQLANTAARFAQVVSKVTNNVPQRRMALQLLASLGKGGPAPMDDDPVSFQEAATAARDALHQMQSSSTRKIKLQRDISRATDAAKKTALQDELNAQQTNYDAARMSARRLLTSAIRLADEETEAGEVAKVRYYLTYVHYQGNEHQEVIKVGQKALAGEVEDVMGQSIAKIMLASHLNLFRLAANDMQRDLQRQQLQQLAKQLTGRWPESEVARKTVADAAKLKVPE